MARRLKWTTEAEGWLEEIYHYIAADDPSAAESLVEELIHQGVLLLEHPRAGRLHAMTQGGEIRILLYRHYRIAYLLGISGDINVLGVFHGALDLSRRGF